MWLLRNCIERQCIFHEACRQDNKGPDWKRILLLLQLDAFLQVFKERRKYFAQQRPREAELVESFCYSKEARYIFMFSPKMPSNQFSLFIKRLSKMPGSRTEHVQSDNWTSRCNNAFRAFCCPLIVSLFNSRKVREWVGVLFLGRLAF